MKRIDRRSFMQGAAALTTSDEKLKRIRSVLTLQAGKVVHEA